MSRLRVWDAPTRLFHWLIVLLVPLMWWTAEEDMMDLHMLFGSVVLGLILFRLIWGLIGGSTARFSSFVRGPGAIRDYLAGRWRGVGHSPVGALSVVALLLLLAIQVGLGLFASDEDGLYSGPLAHLISYDASETLADRHETMFNVLLVFIGLHVAAVFFYLLVRRNDLVTPMVTGRRKAGEEDAPALEPAPAWRFVLAAGLAALLAWSIFNLI